MPNSSGTWRGCTRVPSTMPRPAPHTHDSGRSVSRRIQITSRCTGVAGTNSASGNTIRAATNALERACRDLLEGDAPDRQRRHHPVFDLAAVAEVLHERERDRLDPLEDARDRHDARHEDAENAAEPFAPPTPCPIFGKTYANTNTNSSGCITVRARNWANSFRRTARSRRSNAPNAIAGELWAGPTSGRLCIVVMDVPLIRADPFR